MTRTAPDPLQFLRSALILLVLAVALTAPALAQKVTGSIAGTVTDPDGDPLPGVAVNILHVPTGETYLEITQENGAFKARGVHVGGPYVITLTMPGFATLTESGLNVVVGETALISVTMQLDTVDESP